MVASVAQQRPCGLLPCGQIDHRVILASRHPGTWLTRVEVSDLKESGVSRSHSRSVAENLDAHQEALSRFEIARPVVFNELKREDIPHSDLTLALSRASDGVSILNEHDAEASDVSRRTGDLGSRL